METELADLFGVSRNSVLESANNMAALEPMIFAMLFVLFLLAYIPGLLLWIPNLMAR